MKKLLAILLTVCLCLTLSVGCGSNNSNSSKKIDPSILADDALAALSPQSELIEVSQSVLSNYYNVDSKVVQAYKIYISSAWTAEEVAVFLLVDDKASTITSAKAMINQREDALTASFDGYLPKELEILQENSAVYHQGRIIAFVSGSTEGVAAALTVLRTACEE